MNFTNQTTIPLIRFRVYRSHESRNFLCICAARSARHALEIARQTWKLSRTAHAHTESRPAA